MERLVIQNDMELMCIEEMLKDLPYYMRQEGTKLSAISNKFREETLNKIKLIRQPHKESTRGKKCT